MTREDWAKFWIEEFGQYDGAHHKASCLDQVMQILRGTPVIIKLATWENGHSEHRFSLAEPSLDYLLFVRQYENDGEYSWETGRSA